MPNAPSEFPLTLAEVLFEEIYGDPSSQADRSPGWILNEKIKSERKKKQSHIVLHDSWFDDAERKDWSERAKASDEIVPIIYQALHDRANGVEDRVDADAPTNTGTGTDQ